jgi:YcaO-like protein with predicted kinase domain
MMEQGQVLDSPIAKQFVLGTHRSRDPQDTLQAITPHFGRMGITRLADVTGLDSIGIPVYTAIRPNSKSLSVSQGKGFTPILAKVSAAMEATELYHAENVRLPIHRGSYQSISAACDPLSLPMEPHSIYHPALSLEWVCSTDLIGGREMLLPYDLVHCAYLAENLKPPVFLMSSNGLASGNTPIEALSHAICEVIERDAISLWEMLTADASMDMGLIDLRTIDSAVAQDLLYRLAAAGVTAYVWDMTSDVGLPVFGCAIIEHSPSRSAQMIGPYIGYGCHLCKEIALTRAITEAVQSRLTFIAGSRDDIYRSTYEQLGSPALIQRVQYSRPSVDYRTLPSLAGDSLNEDVSIQLDCLLNAGFESVLRVDLTHAELGIPVVRVVIPNMVFKMQHRGARLPLTPRIKQRLLKLAMIRTLSGGRL